VGSRWDILDKEAKKEKKKRNFRGRRWRNLTEPEKTRKIETQSISRGNECTWKCGNHKQSQTIISMLQAAKSQNASNR